MGLARRFAQVDAFQNPGHIVKRLVFFYGQLCPLGEPQRVLLEILETVLLDSQHSALMLVHCIARVIASGVPRTSEPTLHQKGFLAVLVASAFAAERVERLVFWLNESMHTVEILAIRFGLVADHILGRDALPNLGTEPLRPDSGGARDRHRRSRRKF